MDREAKKEEILKSEEQTRELEKEVPKEIQLIHAELSAEVFARYRQTPCFGRCPVYTITILKDGKAFFEGENFVDHEGEYKGAVSKEERMQLREIANEIRFFEMASIYDNKNVTDLPSIITTLALEEGGHKTVINRYGGPETMREIEKYFQELVKNIQWKRKVEQE